MFTRFLESKLLEALKMNIEFSRGAGQYLYPKNNDGNEEEYLDLLGGYGCGLLGHSNSQLVELQREMICKGEPFMAQLSKNKHSEMLAEALCGEAKLLTGEDYVVFFSNTGSEAIETAMRIAQYHWEKRFEEHHTILERQLFSFDPEEEPLKVKFGDEELLFNTKAGLCKEIRRRNEKQYQEKSKGFLALKRSYHGNTLTAASVSYRMGKSSLGNKATFIDSEDIEKELSSTPTNFPLLAIKISGKRIEVIATSFPAYAAFLAEPVQGEGGVYPLASSTILFIQHWCKVNNLLFIADEVQCGFFRTGKFLNATSKAADMYCIGKAMSGGLTKISATFVKRALYDNELDLSHQSTFAADPHSSAIALKSLKIIQNQTARLQITSSLTGETLNKVAKKFPKAITAVRGKGLMWGIEFKDFSNSNSYFWQYLSRSGLIGYLLSSWILYHFRIRLGVTLSHPHCLRIQPPIILIEKDVQILQKALSSLAEIIHSEDLYKLFEHLLTPDSQGLRKIEVFKHGETAQNPQDPNVPVAGFVVHYLNEYYAHQSEPSLQVISRPAFIELLDFVNLRPFPVIALNQRINLSNGKQIQLVVAGSCFTAEMVNESLASNRKENFTNAVNQAVQLLIHNYQAKVIGLGQYTSIVTTNGLKVNSKGTIVTSGNGLTAAVTINKVKEILQSQKVSVAGVAGAAGHIGSSLCRGVCNLFDKLYLVGRKGRQGEQRLIKAAALLVKEIAENPDTYNGTIGRKIQAALKNHDLKNTSACRLFNIAKEKLGTEMPIIFSPAENEISEIKLLLCATSFPGLLEFGKELKPGTMVIDVSVPSNFTTKDFPFLEIYNSGRMLLPAHEPINIAGFGLPEGQVYACLAETLILASQEKLTRNYSTGKLLQSEMEELLNLATSAGMVAINAKTA